MPEGEEEDDDDDEEEIERGPIGQNNPESDQEEEASDIVQNQNQGPITRARAGNSQPTLGKNNILISLFAIFPKTML